VLFADLRGFTPYSERTAPDQVVGMLNQYFGRAVPLLLANGGTVVQFVGDAVMALFNAPARQPDHALRAARAMLAEGGSVVVADERVEDHFTAPAPDRDRRAYGWSVVSCLPSVMGDPETAATGAVLRPATLAGYAAAAGFGHTETLGVEAEDWRFYRLLP